jgi:hypothetical protein
MQLIQMREAAEALSASALAAVPADRGIGYNVSLTYSDPWLLEWMEDYVHTSHPGLMVLFDTDGTKTDYACRLAAANPQTIFELRNWIPEPGNPKNGDNQQLYLSPRRWREIHAPIAGIENLFGVVNNEPNHTDLARTSDWHEAVMDEAHPRDIRTAIGGYAYGHPEDHTNYRVFDKMVRRMIATPDMAIFDLHEYAKRRVTEHVTGVDHNNPASWPRDVGLGQRWLLGRFLHWKTDCASRGIPFPYFGIGEHGWATRGDVIEDHLFWSIVNGWQREDWQSYMVNSLKWTHDTFYAREPKFLGSALFTLSSSAWMFSSYQHAPQAREWMRKGFGTMAVIAPGTPPYPTGPKVMQTAQSHINIRDENGNDIGDILNGHYVDVLSTVTRQINISGDTYTCQQVGWNGKVGWVALTKSFALVPRITKEDFVWQMRDLLNRYEAQS